MTSALRLNSSMFQRSGTSLRLFALRNPSIIRSKSIPQAQSMSDSRFLAGIGGPVSPCGVDMEIESDLFFRKVTVDIGNVFCFQRDCFLPSCS